MTVEEKVVAWRDTMARGLTHVYTDGSTVDAVRNECSGVFVRTPTGQTVRYSSATGEKRLKFQSRNLSTSECSSLYVAEMKPQKAVILTDSKAALQSLTSNTPDQPIHQLLKDLQLLPMNALWSYCGSLITVRFQEMKEQIAWPSLGANNCNSCPPPLTRKPQPCSETFKNVNGEEPLETTTPLQIQSTVRQDMSRPLYSGCEQDIVACERT